tara:strand:+ start:1196 stop:3520 length:2325 start_codon:yes stop_codon:yes gene_type:complete
MNKNKKIPSSKGPLTGVKVLNIGTAIAGPWAGTLLGYLGADVIKVERPAGEYLRLLFPRQDGIATAYTATNLNQRSAEIDNKKEEGMKAMQQLALQADILIENFRPGVADRIGLGYEALHETNPNLIFGSTSGYGDVGPMKDLAALEPHLQAFSGLSDMTGKSGGDGEMIRFTHLDPTGATFFCGLILLGLIERERFGHACWVRTSHLANTIAHMMNRVAETLMTDEPIERLGSASSISAPNQCFKCLDEKHIAVACDNQKQWEGFCRAISSDELRDDARFKTNVLRVKNREKLAEILQALFETKPSRWWALRFEAESVPFGYNLEFDDLLYHQQIVENEYLTTLHPRHTGAVKVGGLPWQFSKTPAKIDPKVPIPGEDTEEIMKSGFDKNILNQTPKSPTENPELPLKGITVIDLTQGVTGPFLGLLTAEAGATVIKIEPPEGDWAKKLAPETSTGNSALYESFNRNKKIITIDLETKDGLSKLREMIGKADVLIEDWGVDEAEKKELGYEQLSLDNPGLIYLALSAFGEKGPLRNRPGSELITQAFTGYLRTLGEVNEDPVRAGADVASTVTAGMAFISLLASLYHRLQTGEGQRVSTSQLGSLMAIKTLQWSGMTNPDDWEGNFCKNETVGAAYGQRTTDGAIFATPSPALTQEKFFEMIKEFGMYDEFITEKELMDNWWNSFGVGTHSKIAEPLWNKYLEKLTTEQVLEILNRYEVWAVEFVKLKDLIEHPQLQALGMVRQLGDQFYLRAPWSTPWGYPELQSIKYSGND